MDEKPRAFYKVPFIVKVFEKHIDTWSSAAGAIYAKPRKAGFDHIILRSKSILLDTRWYISAVHDVVGEPSMDDLSRRLYRRLKGMECILESKGFLGRKKHFRPSDTLNQLSLFLPEIKVSDELSTMLNDSEEIMSLVRSILPDEMTIALHSMPAKYQPNSKEAAMRGMVAFYERPTQITWIITLVRRFQRGPSATRKADEIIELLDKITTVLRGKMEDLRAHMDR